MKTMKRALCIFLALVLTFSMLTFNTFAADVSEEDVVIVYGDVNKDGKVSFADAFILLLAKLGFMSLDETQKFYGDVDADGAVGFSDIQLILKHCLGLIICFSVYSSALTEGEKTEDTHFLDSCYKYDVETGLYEYCFDITIPEEDGISLRVATHIKGNKQNTNAYLNSYNMRFSYNVRYITDGEKNYLLLPMMRIYSEVENEDIIVEDEDLQVENLLLFLLDENSYVGSTKNSFGGIDYICEKYTLDGEYCNFWFTTAGKPVKVELLGDTEDETEVFIINEFSPDVDDSVFLIPSYYVKVEFDKLLKFSDVIFI